MLGGSADARALRARREEMLLRLLLRAQTSMNNELMARLQAQGHPDVLPAHTRLLGHVDTEGTRIVALARRMGTTRQAAGQLLQEVEKRGFVERLSDPEDGRGVVVRHTARGKKLLLDAVRVMSEIEAEYQDAIGTTDFQHLKRALKKLVAHADPQGSLGLD